MRRKRYEPMPDPGGYYIRDPETGQEHWLSYEDMHIMCRDMMDPVNASVIAAEYGKVHFSQDPTYNLRKRK